jgi:uncharacterized membrane protein
LVPHVLSVAGGIGATLVIWGVATTTIWPTVLGMVIVFASKLWFIDRMVWLYAEMKHATPEYRAWDRE